LQAQSQMSAFTALHWNFPFVHLQP